MRFRHFIITAILTALLSILFGVQAFAEDESGGNLEVTASTVSSAESEPGGESEDTTLTVSSAESEPVDEPEVTASTESSAEGEPEGNLEGEHGGNPEVTTLLGDHADYEVDADNNATLIRLHDFSDDIAELVIRDSDEIDGWAFTITGIAAGFLSDAPNIRMLALPTSVTHIDEKFLAGSNVTNVNIPSNVEGRLLLEGSNVERITIESRDVIEADLLYQPLPVDESWEWIHTDWWRYPFTEYPDVFEELCEQYYNGESRWALQEVDFYGHFGEIEEDAFACCTALQFAHGLANVERIGRFAFAYCESLEEAILEVSEIREGTFLHCVNMKHVDINEDSAVRIPVGDGAFMVCTALESFPENVSAIGQFSFAVTSFSNDITIPDVDIPYRAFWKSYAPSIAMETDDGQSDVMIGNEAFLGCGAPAIVLSEHAHTLGDSAFMSSKIESIDLTFVTSIGSSAFYGCSKLARTVRIPAVTMSPGAFRDCTAMTGVNFFFPDGNMNAYEISAYAFTGCSALSSVTLPDGLNSIGDSAFGGCTSLLSVEIPACNAIGKSAFSGCTKLKIAVLPEAVTSLGEEAFSGCTKLTTVNIPRVETIPSKAFYRCLNLKEAIVPEGVVTIGDDAFRNCMYMENIKLPDSLERIGNRSFAICQSVKSIDLGNGVKYIGTSAFEYCDLNLSEVTIPCSVVEIGPFAFMSCQSLNALNLPAPSHPRTIGGGFLYGTKIISFTLYKDDSFTHETHHDGVLGGSDDHDYGALTGAGADVMHIIVNEDVTEIPSYFCYNRELVQRSMSINILGSDIRIGSKAFYNSHQLGPIIDFYAGPPSFVAADAFGTDAGEDALTGSGTYREKSEAWTACDQAFEQGSYGRIINLRYVQPPEIVWNLSDDDVLTISTIGGSALMRDFYDPNEYNIDPDDPESADMSALFPPWAEEAKSAKKVVITSNILNIGRYAFSGSTTIKEIEIQGDLWYLRPTALYGCSGLKTLYIKGSMPYFDWLVFETGHHCAVCYPDNDDPSWDPVRTIAASAGTDSTHFYGAERLVWMKDSSFNLYRDNNKASNTYSSSGLFSDYNTKYLYYMHQAVTEEEFSKVESEAHQRIKRATDFYGVCWGLSSTMMLHAMHVESPFFGSTPYFDLNLTGDYKDVIKYYHLVQFAPVSFSPTASIVKKNNGDYNEMELQALLRKIVELSSIDDNICFLRFGYNSRKKENGSAHAVVVCGCEFGNFDNKGGNEYAVRIYDCNASTRYYYMFIDENYQWFTFQDSNLSASGEKLEDIWVDFKLFQCSDLDDLTHPVINSKSPLRSLKNASTRARTSSSEHAVIIVSADRSFELVNAEGEKLIAADNGLKGDMPRYSEISNISMDGERDFYLETNPSESYEISNIDGDFRFIAKAGSKVWNLSVSSADVSRVSGDKGIEISGAGEKTYTLSIMDPDQNNAFTQVSGTVDGDISMTMQDEDIVVRSAGAIRSMDILSDASGDLTEKELTEADLGSACSSVSFNPGAQNSITPVIAKDETAPVDPVIDKDEAAPVNPQNDKPSSVTKKANPMTVKGKTVKVKHSKLKKKAVKITVRKAMTVSNAQGMVTYKKVSVGSAKVNKKYGKKISVNSKTGKITVKKGLKEGNYKLKIKVTAAGSLLYKKKSKNVVVKIKVV